jgi:cell division protein FtsB
LAIIFVILIRSLWDVYQKEQLSAKNLLREQIEFDKLTSREKSLVSSIDHLKTEQGVESEIRNKFRVVKEGEQVAVIVDNNASNMSSVATTTHSFWYKLFHWFW